MIRILVAILLSLGFAMAAPVPRELRNAPTLFGTWREGVPDLNEPGKFTSHYWSIDEKHQVAFGQNPEEARAAGKSEIFKCDHSNGHCDHSLVHGNQTQAHFQGRYELNGDRLTIILDTSGKSRPKSVREAGFSVWHLERVKDSK